jgi:hypothetical protein
LKKIDLGNFGFETSKGYMAAFIVLFHIVPLMTVFTKSSFELMSVLFMIVNPMAVFILSMFFGIKQGFSWKLPLFAALVFAPSVIMYYTDMQTPENIIQAVRTTVIFMIVYLIFSFIACAIGALIKRWL